MFKKLINVLSILLCSAVVQITYAESPFAKLKDKASAHTGTAILKGAGLLECPKGQKCYCSNANKSNGYKVTCNYHDKDKGVHTIDKTFNDIGGCISLCLGKSVANLNKDDVRGVAETPPTPEQIKAAADKAKAAATPKKCTSWVLMKEAGSTDEPTKVCQRYEK